MPRPKASEPRDQQLLLRLTARQLEVLESVAHLERTRPNAYAHQLLVEHLASMISNPHVQADLANRAEYDRQGSSATPLRPSTAAAKRANPQASPSGSRRSS